jgi:hypothetical protein
MASAIEMLSRTVLPRTFTPLFLTPAPRLPAMLPGRTLPTPEVAKKSAKKTALCDAKMLARYYSIRGPMGRRRQAHRR